jgi:hypothetical protein
MLSDFAKKKAQQLNEDSTSSLGALAIGSVFTQNNQYGKISEAVDKLGGLQIKKAVIDLFTYDKNINDEKVHKAAEAAKMDPHQFENVIYSIMSSFFGSGKFNQNPNVIIDPVQLAAGIKVEMEHTDCPLIAERIAKDHLAEFGDYYSRLDRMEANAKKSVNPMNEELITEESSLEFETHKDWDEFRVSAWLKREGFAGVKIESAKNGKIKLIGDTKTLKNVKNTVGGVLNEAINPKKYDWSKVSISDNTKWDDKNFMSPEEARSMADNRYKYIPFHKLDRKDQDLAKRMYVYHGKAGGIAFSWEHYYYPVKKDGSLASTRRILAIPYKKMNDEVYMKSIGYDFAPALITEAIDPYEAVVVAHAKHGTDLTSIKSAANYIKDFGKNFPISELQHVLDTHNIGLKSAHPDAIGNLYKNLSKIQPLNESIDDVKKKVIIMLTEGKNLSTIEKDLNITIKTKGKISDLLSGNPDSFDVITEAKETPVIVTMDGYEYEIVIMDSTHLKMRSKGINSWGTPLHIAQVDDEVVDQLREKGLMKGNALVESGLENTELMDPYAVSGNINDQKLMKEDDESKMDEKMLKAGKNYKVIIAHDKGEPLYTSSFAAATEMAAEYGKGTQVLDLARGDHLKPENKENTFTYQMLGRLQSDCEYFLGHGNRNEKRLHQGNVDDQIKEMKKLWNSLPKDKKPDWLSMDDINSYEKKMKA